MFFCLVLLKCIGNTSALIFKKISHLQTTKVHWKLRLRTQRLWGFKWLTKCTFYPFDWFLYKTHLSATDWLLPSLAGVSGHVAVFEDL